MHMSATFKATLTTEIRYTTLNGKTKTLRAGQSIDVALLSSSVESSDLTGATVAETPQAFIGSAGLDSFDLDRTEFQLLQ